MRDFLKEFIKDKLTVNPKKLDTKIKLMTKYSCPPDTTNRHINSKTEFDYTGNKTDYKEYKVGKIICWEKYGYDNDTLIEKSTGKCRFQAGCFKERDFTFITEKIVATEIVDIANEIIDISASGQKVLTKFHQNGKLASRQFFDVNNVCTESHKYGSTGEISCRRLFDKYGNLLESRNFSTDGKELNFTINTYNDQAKLSRSISTSRTGYINEDAILKYDGNGLLSEVVGHPSNPDNCAADKKGESDGYSHKYTYINDKLLGSDTMYLCGKLIMKYEFDYVFW